MSNVDSNLVLYSSLIRDHYLLEIIKSKLVDDGIKFRTQFSYECNCTYSLEAWMDIAANSSVDHLVVNRVYPLGSIYVVCCSNDRH